MSRNKDIEVYHKISGLSYKECRANLKANHWDLVKVLLPELSVDLEVLNNTIVDLEVLNNTMKAVVQILGDCFEVVGKACIQLGESLRGDLI